MSQQIALGAFDPQTGTVEVRGDFQGWTSGYSLTNDPTILVTNQYGLVTSNVYVGTYLLAGSPGQVNEFKYFIEPNDWESPSSLNGVGQNNNRFVFNVPDQTLPIVFFSDQPLVPVVTNNVTFSVDMTVPIWSGLMTTQQVSVNGPFNNWTGGANLLTNNPSAPNPNIYSATIAFTNGVGANIPFKFFEVNGSINGGWENNPTVTYPGNPSVLSGGNRSFNMPDVNNSNLILPTVYFNDVSTNSVLPVPTTVTFSVNMTNAVGTDGHVFNSGADNVYVNGLVVTNPVGQYSWAPWTNSPAGNPLGAFLMTNNPPGSEVYSLQLTIPAGYPILLDYQYSINGNQDEATNLNHIRYVRSLGNYVLPLDTFGSMVQEPSFGNLAIGPKSGSAVSITWQGRPGVHLQVRTNLTAGAWMDLPGTDAQNATNYPVGAGASYFRLINPF